MGNQLYLEGKEPEVNNSGNQEPMLAFDNISSFKGIKTEGSEKQNKNTNSQTSDKTAEKISKDSAHFNKEKVPFTFEWKEGGNWVLITGSFLNWQQNHTMIKNGNGVFTHTLEITPGVHKFKFIVDNKWRCSQHYTTLKDELNNVNNIIDLTSYVSNNNSSPPVKSNQLKASTKSTSPPPHVCKNEYISNVPMKSEMNNDCPCVPFHYQKKYNIDYNTKQNIVGDNAYLNYCERNLLSENNSYKKILVPPHVNLNHHCSKFISQDGSVKFCRLIKACASQRIRHKFLTIIYYNSSGFEDSKI